MSPPPEIILEVKLTAESVAISASQQHQNFIELSIKLSNYITTLELKDRLLTPLPLHCLATTDDDSIAP
jgi:hypothetical protein